MIAAFALALLTAPSVHTDFESGSLGAVVRVAETHFRCAVKGQADQDRRNRQASWYYFRLDDAAGREITIDLTDLTGEYNYKPGARAIRKDTPGVYSYDNEKWQHFSAAEWQEGADSNIRLRFAPAQSPVWIAHVPPYTNARLERLLSQFAKHPHFRRQTIGKSVEGRNLEVVTITDFVVPEVRKKTVWLMFRQHSWETGSSWVGEGVIRFLLSLEAAAPNFRNDTMFKILPMADPDGVANGGVRFNANGFDLNRNWDAVDAAKMPEIAAQRKQILDWVDVGRHIDLMLSLHNTETAEYLAYPTGAAFVPTVNTLFSLLTVHAGFNASRPPLDEGASTAAGKPGRMNVCQGLFADRKIPCVLMEQQIAFNAKLNRLPEAEDRLKFGAALIKCVWSAVHGRLCPPFISIDQCVSSGQRAVMPNRFPGAK